MTTIERYVLVVPRLIMVWAVVPIFSTVVSASVNTPTPVARMLIRSAWQPMYMTERWINLEVATMLFGTLVGVVRPPTHPIHPHAPPKCSPDRECVRVLANLALM
jgi:hypothetical protein